LIERLENVATPEAPETGALPVSVAPGVPVPGVIATATFPAKPAVLANWSRMVTTTLEMLVTAVALPGCVVIECGRRRRDGVEPRARPRGEATLRPTTCIRRSS
jgi:hypothetical protein